MTRKVNPLKFHHIASLSFALAILIGSFFWPVLGLAVPVLVLAAVVSNIFKPRWFCANACPRANILSGFLPRISHYREVPKALYSGAIRKILCGFMMFCAIGQTVRLWKDFQKIGFFFSLICALTLGMAIIAGIVFKPRAWCAFCPIGTLQDTLRGK